MPQPQQPKQNVAEMWKQYNERMQQWRDYYAQIQSNEAQKRLSAAIQSGGTRSSISQQILPQNSMPSYSSAQVDKPGRSDAAESVPVVLPYSKERAPLAGVSSMSKAQDLSIPDKPPPELITSHGQSAVANGRQTSANTAVGAGRGNIRVIPAWMESGMTDRKPEAASSESTYTSDGLNSVPKGVAHPAVASSLFKANNANGRGRGSSRVIPAWMQNQSSSSDKSISSKPDDRGKQIKKAREHRSVGRGSDRVLPAWMLQRKANTSKPEPSQPYPASLQSYVQKNMQECRRLFPGNAKIETGLNADIIKLLEKLKGTDELWTKDWDNEPFMERLRANATKPRFIKLHSSVPEVTENSGTRSRSRSGARRKKKRKKSQATRSRSRSRVSSSIPSLTIDHAELAARENRAKRFKRQASKSVEYQNSAASGSTDKTISMLRSLEGGQHKLEWEKIIVRGTCQRLKKSYYRLNEVPAASDVRPEEVLKRAHADVMRQWHANPRECSYEYANDQLKAIRQDLTVQHISTDFTVIVYETHARITLEQMDILEFNQCVTQLHRLYRTGGSSGKGLRGCVCEFTAYEFLYLVYIGQKYGNSGAAQLHALLRETPRKVLYSSCVDHALSVRRSVAVGDYEAFFRLRKSAPYMSANLMCLLDGKMRHDGLRLLTRAFRPTLSVEYTAEVLGIDGSTAEAKKILEEAGVLFVSNEDVIDTKNSQAVFVKPYVFVAMDGDGIAEPVGPK